MKISKSLLEICNKLFPITNTNSRISPIFSMFCFTGKTIEAFNGVQGMKVDFDTDFVGCVNSKDLINALTAYNDRDIDIKNDEDKLILKSGKSKVSLITTPVENFIQFGVSKKKKMLFEITQDFIEGLKQCKLSTPKNDLRPQQYGIAVVDNILYSTNNISISRYETGIDNSISFLLPPLFYEQIIKLYNTNVTLYMDKDILEVDFDGIRLYTKIDTSLVLLDYASVVQKFEDDTILVTIPVEFKEAVARIKSINTGTNRIHLDISDTDIEVSATSALCNVKEVIDIENLTNPISCDYDIEKFANGLKVIDEFKFTEDGKAVIMYGKSGVFTHILTSIIR